MLASYKLWQQTRSVACLRGSYMQLCQTDGLIGSPMQGSQTVNTSAWRSCSGNKCTCTSAAEAEE